MTHSSTVRVRHVPVRRAVATLAITAALGSACSGPDEYRIAAATTSTTQPPLLPTSIPSSTIPGSDVTTTSLAGIGFRPVAAPTLDATRTDAFPASGPLPDGRYWAVYHGGEVGQPFLTIMEAYFGEECVARAEAVGEECLNDVFVPVEPTRDLKDLRFADDAFVSLADVRTAQSLQVSTAELVAASTGAPGDGAPVDYEYVPFPFVMTIVSGDIVAFEQLWLP